MPCCKGLAPHNVLGLFMAYETDLSNGEWALIVPFIPPPKTGGRPRSTDERRVVDGILYMVKTGCQWRLLPDAFPPWQTVYRFFAAWRQKGVWKKIHYALHIKARRKEEGRHLTPSAVVIDSQSVKTGKLAQAHTRGFDGGKRVKGRKRFLVTDTLGLPMEVAVTPANVHDTKGGRRVLRKIVKRNRRRVRPMRIQAIFADKGFGGRPLAQWAQTQLGARIVTSENPAQKVKHFVPMKKRWVVERAFAWIGDYYRLSVDRERRLVNSVTMVRIACIRVLMRRLHP